MREQPDAGKLRAAALAVEAPEQLVAAADGEQRGAVLYGLDQPVLASEIGRDQRLLPVLAAADVEEVVLAGPHVQADADRVHVELVPAPSRPTGEDGDVPTVGVDVQVVRIEVRDPDPHAACSQYGRVKPRSVTIRRSASIAV